jgi:hypothetical protein
MKARASKSHEKRTKANYGGIGCRTKYGKLYCSLSDDSVVVEGFSVTFWCADATLVSRFVEVRLWNLMQNKSIQSTIHAKSTAGMKLQVKQRS